MVARKKTKTAADSAIMREALRLSRKREKTATKIVKATYDRGRDVLIIDLSTEATLIVPRHRIVGFANARPSQLADLAIMPGREALWSDSVDDGVLLEQLLVIVAGRDAIGTIGARVNASKKSAARAAASRANGAMGGRPKKIASL